MNYSEIDLPKVAVNDYRTQPTVAGVNRQELLRIISHQLGNIYRAT